MSRSKHSMASARFFDALALLASLLLISWLPISTAAAEDDDIRFRRVKIPETDIKKHVTGLLPRRRDEFERLVKAKVTPRHKFESAKYKAALSDGTLRGTCELQKAAVPKRSDQQRTTFIELGGEISVEDPFWDSSNGRRRALVGRTAAGGRTLIEDDANSEQLSFTWNEVGQAVDANVLRFDLTCPKAFRHELQVVLPADVELLSSQGVVTPPYENETDNASEPDPWSVHWSGVEKIRLTVVPRNSQLALPPFDTRHRTTYHFRSTGVRIESTLLLTLSSALPPPNTFRIELDPSLTINSIKSKEQPLRWTEASGAPSALDVVMPTSASGDQVAITIDASANCTLDRDFDLPRIKTTGRWISEQIDWVTHAPLTVVDVVGQGTQCESIDSTSGSGEVMEFVLESRDSSIQLKLQRALNELSAETFIRASLDEKSVTVDVEAHFEPMGREFFDLLVEVDSKSGWVFGSVDAFADTTVLGLTGSVMERYERVPGEKSEQIRVFLKQAATAKRPLTLRLRLQNNSLDPEISLPNLSPVSFPDVEDIKTWIYVRANPSVDLKINGGENAEWVAPSNEIPAWIANIVAEENGVSSSLSPGEIFSDESLASDMLLQHRPQSNLTRIVRSSKPALLRVNSDTRVYISEEETRYAYEWNIDPLGEALSQVDILFSSRITTGDSLWSLDDRAEIPSLQKLKPVVSDDPDWVRYRVTFDTISKPFQLQFRFSESSRDALKVPLSSVDQTSSEYASVALYASGTVGLDIQPGEGLIGIPIEIFERQINQSDFVGSEGEGSDVERLRTAYSYNKTTANLIPSLKLTNKPMPIQSALIAWRCDVRSFYSEQGRPRHRADFFLQNDGVGKFRIDFPDDYALDNVEIDGVKLKPQPRLSSDGMLFLTLPAANRFPCVSIRYVQPEKSLRAIDWLQPPMQMAPLNDRNIREVETEIPRSNASCLQTTWQVWLPRDYQTYSSLRNAANDSWSERLFGSFGSASGPKFLATAWRSLRRRLVPDAGSSSIIDQAKSHLGRNWVGNRVGEGAAATNTWGGRLRQVRAEIERSNGEFQLFVDREELRRMGVFVDTPLPKTRYTKARQMGVDRLVQAGLAMILDGNRAIITSASEVKERSAGSNLIDGIVLEGNATWFPTSRLQSVEAWQDDATTELWHPSSDALEIGFQQGGWVSSRRIVGNAATSLRIFHRDTAVALSCSFFFIGFAVGWISYENRRRWVVLLAMGFVLALLLPRPGASFAVAFGWSILLSGLAQFVYRRNKKPEQTVQRRRSVRFAPTRAAVLLLALAFAATCISNTRGQDQPTQDEPADESLVYFPYNKDESLSDYVYLSAAFDQILNTRDQKRAFQPDYLFRTAIYSGTWPDQAGSKKTIRFLATFDLTTFAKETLVRIPIVDQPKRVLIEQSSILLDGTLTALESDGSLLVARPGDHRIVVPCLAEITRKEDQWQTRFSIPSMTKSRLQISLPRDVESIVIPSAGSLGNIDTNRGVVSADLGATSEMVVRVTLPATTAERSEEVDQLTLLRINRDGATLETRFRFVGKERPLKLKVDKELIPTTKSVSYGNWDAERLELDTDLLDVSEGIRFRISPWTKSESSSPTSLGRFRLPSVSPTDVPVRNSQLAIITSRDILAKYSSEGAEVLPREEFAGDWGTLEKNPDVVFDVNTGTPELQIVHAQQTENWNSEIAYYFGARHTEFDASIQLVPVSLTPSMVTVRRFGVPKELDVNDVRASTSLGVPLRLRWRSNENGLVLFFLDQPEISQAVPIDISISGRLQHNVEKLPLISTGSLSSDTFVSQTIVLYRADNVQLTPESPFTFETNPGFTSKRRGYRYAGSWSDELFALDDEQLEFVVKKELVQQELTGSLTTSLRHDSEGWAAHISADVRSDEGELDAIHFDVPYNLTQTVPIANEGEIDLTVEVSGGAGLDRRTVTVWLPPSTEGNTRTARKVTLVARMPADQIRLPQVRFVNVNVAIENGHRQQFVELPSRSTDESNSRFEWRWNGLVVAEAQGDAASKRYRVTRNEFSAELNKVRTGGVAEVFLLETTASWRSASNEFFVMAQFDLKPANLKEVLIELPLQSELYQLMCDEVPSYSTEIRDDDTVRKYRVPLTAAPWPQRLRVVYRTKPAHANGRVLRLDAPRLLAGSSKATRRIPIPIRNSIWNVYSSSQSDRFAEPKQSGVNLLSSDDADRLLLKSFSELWTNSQVSVRENRDDKAAWLHTWAVRLQDTLERVKQRPDFVSNPELQTINDLLEEYPDVFDPDWFESDLLDITSGRRRQQAMPKELWNESQWLSGNQLRCSTPSETSLDDIQRFPHLNITHLSNYDPSFGRFLVAGLFVGCAFVLPRWQPMTRVASLCQTYPHLVMMGIGLVWWFLLTPAWIGLLIVFVVAAIWLAVFVRNRRLKLPS